MVEPVIETSKTDPVASVEPPKVNVENHIDLSAVLNKIDAMASDFATFKTNAEADKAEIARLKAAEEVRINAQKATEDKMISDFVGSHILAAFQGERDALVSDYKVNASLFFTKHNDKIDWASFQKPQTISPAGAAFVPHVNTAEDDDLKGLMPTDEEAGMRKVA